MVEAVSREIRLRNIPVGMPSHTDFELVEVPTPKPGWGEILVRNLYLSVDPYMRMTLLQPGEPLEGSCVGQVVESRGNWFQIGDYVWGMLGWRDYNLSDGAGLLSID